MLIFRYEPPVGLVILYFIANFMAIVYNSNIRIIGGNIDLTKIYLDNCCYNRPFDNQTQLKIHLETIAKLQIQRDVRDGKYELVWSYVLDYENSMNPFDEKRQSIEPWRNIADQNIIENEEIIRFAEILKEEGIKTYDALHISCAVNAGCEYFLTTDRKLLNHKIDGIRIIDPVAFISEQEDKTND